MTQAALKKSQKDSRGTPTASDSRTASSSDKFKALVCPVLAADCGNRQIKYGRDSQKITVIPAYYKVLLPYETPFDSDGSVVLEYLDGVNEALKGQRWVVGKLARELNGIPTFEGEKSEVYARFALAAVDCPDVKRSKVIPVRVEAIRVCIPDIQDTEKVEGIQQSLKGHHRYKRNGTLLDLQIHNVLVEAEGISAFEFLKAQKLFKWPSRVNGIIDAGGGNVTATLFSSSGHPIWDSRITLDGTKELAQLIARDPVLVGVEASGVSPRIEVILDAIASKKLEYRGARKNAKFAKAYKTHLDAWLEDFKRKLNSKWNSFFAEFGQAAVIGGSAPLLQSIAAKSKGRIFVVKQDPATVTARGMLVSNKGGK